MISYSAEIAKYSQILKEQQVILAQDPDLGAEALARVELEGKVGTRLNPDYDDMDVLIRHCRRVCRMNPENLDDRAYIALAANTVILFLTMKLGDKSRVKKEEDRHQKLREILRQPHMQKLLKEQSLHESDVLPDLETELFMKRTRGNAGGWVPFDRIEEYRSNPFDLLNNTFVLEKKGHTLHGQKYRITDVELEDSDAHEMGQNSSEKLELILYLQTAECWDAEVVNLRTVLNLLRYSRYYTE